MRRCCEVSVEIIIYSWFVPEGHAWTPLDFTARELSIEKQVVILLQSTSSQHNSSDLSVRRPLQYQQQVSRTRKSVCTSGVGSACHSVTEINKQPVPAVDERLEADEPLALTQILVLWRQEVEHGRFGHGHLDSGADSCEIRFLSNDCKYFHVKVINTYRNMS